MALCNVGVWKVAAEEERRVAAATEAGEVNDRGGGLDSDSAAIVGCIS